MNGSCAKINNSPSKSFGMITDANNWMLSVMNPRNVLEHVSITAAGLSHQLSVGCCSLVALAEQTQRPNNPHQSSLLESHGGRWSLWRARCLILHHWRCIHPCSPPKRDTIRIIPILLSNMNETVHFELDGYFWYEMLLLISEKYL